MRLWFPLLAASMLALLSACGSLPFADGARPGSRATLALLETTDLHANVLSYDYYKLQADPALGRSVGILETLWHTGAWSVLRGIPESRWGEVDPGFVRLAEKAFRPGRFPFPLMHVDTGHNFPEVIAFRDRRVEEIGEELIVASVQDSIDAGRAVEETGHRASRNKLQTVTLLDAIAEHRFDAAFGGARRDEERARAKERIFSFRDDFGGWDPKRQRPELWNLYNGRVKQGENVRVFPLSNWTELDVWRYIELEALEVPSIYFAHEREVFARDGMLYADSPFVSRYPSEDLFRQSVRYRTVGDMSCTGAVPSEATTLQEVVGEIAATRITERGETRADDRAGEAAMEDRKRVGYF